MPCQGYTFQAPTAATLEVKLTWDGPTLLQISQWRSQTTQCCASPEDYKFLVSAGQAGYLYVVFIGTKAALGEEGAPAGSQPFTLTTSLSPTK